MADPQIAPEQSLLPTRVENARSLLVVLSIMALLAGLALLFSRGAGRLSDNWQSQLSETATVQILFASEAARPLQMQTAEITLARLLPDAEITPLSPGQARALLDPWLGNTPLPDDIPVPGLITLESRQTLNTDGIAEALEAEGVSARVDDHTRYADGLRGTARQLVLLGSALVLLLMTAGLAVNIFATRAGLSAQREIIRVLVQVGATDEFIARLFVGQAGMRGAIGAAIGLGLAAFIWLLLSFGGFLDLTWSGAGVGIVDILCLIALGIVFALICAGAAGLTAMRQLRFERRRM